MRSFSREPCAAPDLRSGGVVAGKYVLARPLGAGAMGQVWVAQNRATLGAVVLKSVHADCASSKEARALLLQEARAMARVQHRNVIRVFDLVEGTCDGALVIVMEWLQGETLAARLAAHRRLNVTEAIEIVVPLLSALTHAHAMGILHRDLKPENIFLAREPDGTIVPKLLDFGVAKSTAAHAEILEQHGALSGTPCYMSPEQARGDIDIDGRSDVFAMGVVLHELLSGHNPFARDSVAAVLHAVVWDDPPPIRGVSEDVRKVVARAMAKRREDRYGSARALADALVRAARKTTPVPASITGSVRRHARVALAFAAATTVMLGGLTPTAPDTYARAIEPKPRPICEIAEKMHRLEPGCPVPNVH